MFPCDGLTQLEFECAPPNLHWFDLEWLVEATNPFEILKLLDVSNISCAEDVTRQTWKLFKPKNGDAVRLTVEYMRNFIDDEGPFDGVIGLSEGASAAATVLVDHLEICQIRGSPRTIQCGIFFVGLPPLKLDCTGWLLGDETDKRITVPTCHILSYEDPLVALGESLWNLCDPDISRTRVLHNKGHVIPHESALMAQVAKFVRELKHGET